MSTLISAENLGHSFHDNWLFRQLGFGINSGRRVALVGANGAGKSTLLKLLAEKIQPVEGKVVKSKGLQLGYLDQDPVFNLESTISDFIFQSGSQQQQLIKRYEELLENDPDNVQALEDITMEISEQNAWEYEYRIKTILGRLDIHHLNQKIKTLSGGQRKRLALAQLLIEDPEIFILDEPTNHLDIDTIEWLESFLTSGHKTILLVTHDRYFLDNVCNEILEIDRGKIFNYNGNYSYYLEKKAERDATDQAQFQKNANLLRKELEWMRRQPQARTTKSKSRIEAFYDLEEKTKTNGPNGKVDLSVKASRQGNKVMEISHLKKSFAGQTIIDGFNYVFKKGDRIGLCGKNGSGKTTFLNLITAKIVPDTGTVDKGETTVIGYYNQSGLSFNENQRVIDVVTDVAEYINMADGKTITASQLLTHFLFPPGKQYGMVGNLSGGEKKRLHLMQVLIQNPNFLILDEPTNDLDIDTLNVLEDFLISFTGVLVLVSHDRYLLDKITEQLFILDGTGDITLYNGNYTDHRFEQEEIKLLAKKADKKKQSVPSIKKNFNFKDQKQLEETESSIASLELNVKALNQALNSGNLDHKELISTSLEIEDIKEKLELETLRWLTLVDQKENA
ncbi:MAG: ABC-F family ATP-binding cassette domain-containing protein [Sphingobacteriaceae bacterium]